MAREFDSRLKGPLSYRAPTESMTMDSSLKSQLLQLQQASVLVAPLNWIAKRQSNGVMEFYRICTTQLNQNLITQQSHSCIH